MRDPEPPASTTAQTPGDDGPSTAADPTGAVVIVDVSGLVAVRVDGLVDALRAVPDAELVVLTDGPLPDASEVVEALGDADAACVVAPVVDAVKRVAEAEGERVVVDAVDRSPLRYARLPLVVRRTALEAILAAAGGPVAAAGPTTVDVVPALLAAGATLAVLRPC